MSGVEGRTGVQIPASPPNEKQVELLFNLFFYVVNAGFCAAKAVPLLCNVNPCGLMTNEEGSKRVAFADIECSLIANKSDTKCRRTAQCNARFVARRRSVL